MTKARSRQALTALGHSISCAIVLAVSLVFLTGSPRVWAQAPRAPRLAVVIVVDQMRADYLSRFREYFGDSGFNLFLDHGAWLKQARYAHSVTVTCTGHATILTGSPPSLNGIIANDWWNKAQSRKEYCARDDDSPLLGSDSPGRSPKNLIGATVGDMLKLASGGKSRVACVAGKDRAAIMLCGHRADAAYWLDGPRFVTSTYYRDALPDWVERLNASQPVEHYFGKTWDRILPAEAYAKLGADDEPAELDLAGLGRTFPHVIGGSLFETESTRIKAFDYSPFDNEVVINFAVQMLRNEEFGSGPATDLLAVGLSANDRIGHTFGPDSNEMLDVTVRTDRLLEKFFKVLDEEIGLENTVIVLTADHGVAPIPEVIERRDPQAGARRLDPEYVRDVAESALTSHFGATWGRGDWIVYKEAPYIYLDDDRLASDGIDVSAAATIIKQALESVPGISAAYTRNELERPSGSGPSSGAAASFYASRSGDVMYFKKPYVIEQSEPGGTSHGSPWDYDRHVPLLWYGSAISPGTKDTEVFVHDIAPTLSALLGVDPPPESVGRVLTEVLR